MSTNESLTQPDDNTPEQAITVQPSAMTAYAGPADWALNGEDSAEQAAVSPLALLHAVRRHWLVIVSTGLACAGLAGTAPLLDSQAPIQGRSDFGTETFRSQAPRQGS